MSKILSQEEIDSLLASAAAGQAHEIAAPQGGAGPLVHDGSAVLYNFRRPDRISKEQLRSLHFLHDRFALNVSTSLSAFLRAMTEVSIVSVEQFAYSEFLMSLPDTTAFYAVGMHPLDGLAALELNPAVAFTMVDRLLGGTGKTEAPGRALTEIELNVVDSIIKLLLDGLGEAWKPITEVHFRPQGRETRPQMLQVTGANEVVILLVFDIRIGDTRGMLNLCIPATSVEAVGEKFAQGWHRRRRQPTATEEAWLHTNLGRMPMPVTALLETTLSARDLLALQPGDVIALGHPAASPVQIHVGAVHRFDARLTRQAQGTAAVVDRAIDPAGEPAVQESAA